MRAFASGTGLYFFLASFRWSIIVQPALFLLLYGEKCALSFWILSRFVFMITLSIWWSVIITIGTFYFNNVLISMLILFRNPRLTVEVWGKISWCTPLFSYMVFCHLLSQLVGKTNCSKKFLFIWQKKFYGFKTVFPSSGKGGEWKQ